MGNQYGCTTCVSCKYCCLSFHLRAAILHCLPHYVFHNTSWHKKLKLDWESGKVDCSQVILSNGRGLILNSIRCYLCGRTEGLKDKCDHDCCRLMKKGDGHSYFHVSCARQAGLEVNTSNNEGRSMYFYGTKFCENGLFDFPVCSHLFDFSALLQTWGKQFQFARQVGGSYRNGKTTIG